jgi:hypothetical protein
MFSIRPSLLLSQKLQKRCRTVASKHVTDKRRKVFFFTSVFEPDDAVLCVSDSTYLTWNLLLLTLTLFECRNGSVTTRILSEAEVFIPGEMQSCKACLFAGELPSICYKF